MLDVFNTANKSKNLCMTRDAGFYMMPHRIERNRMFIPAIIADHIRPWPDHGHITQKYIQQLGQFIKMGIPQKFSDPRDPRIIFHGWLVIGVPVDIHRPEFYAMKNFTLSLISFLNKENRAL